MRRSGFTILEITLVLAVFLILAAITLPSIDAMYSDLRLSAAADAIRGRWAEARARAMEDGVAYRFAVVHQTGKYRIAPDAGEHWSGGEGTLGESESPPLIVEDALPQPVLFSNDDGAEGGDWSTVAVFQPDGTAQQDVEVKFAAGSGRPLVLRLRGLTGSVTMPRENGK
jgi:prepilin-type N-terminal cleavage/methylation domain-containing protein